MSLFQLSFICKFFPDYLGFLLFLEKNMGHLYHCVNFIIGNQ